MLTGLLSNCCEDRVEEPFAVLDVGEDHRAGLRLFGGLSTRLPTVSKI